MEVVLTLKNKIKSQSSTIIWVFLYVVYVEMDGATLTTQIDSDFWKTNTRIDTYIRTLKLW